HSRCWTSVEGAQYSFEQLVDSDETVGVDIEGRTLLTRYLTKGYVHASQQPVDGHPAIAVAVAGARNLRDQPGGADSIDGEGGIAAGESTRQSPARQVSLG